MKYFNKIEKTVIGIVIVIGLVFAYSSGGNASLSGQGSTASQKCEVSTVTFASVGNQSSSQILAISSNRAWARIQQRANATNTVYLNFNEGEAATLTSGLLLGNGSATSSVDTIDFGLGTAFSYTGAVTGITDNGSTTLHVTECKYTS